MDWVAELRCHIERKHHDGWVPVVMSAVEKSSSYAKYSL
jgi:hypothetical protein